MQEPIVDMYDPKIYPRKLWVATSPIDLDKQFVFLKTDGSREEHPTSYKNIMKVYYEKIGDMITASVMRKSDGSYGAIVIFLEVEDNPYDVIAHESVHVADYMFEDLGMYPQEYSDANEQYAYLVGWAAGSISNTLIKLKKDDERRKYNDVES